MIERYGPLLDKNYELNKVSYDKMTDKNITIKYVLQLF